MSFELRLSDCLDPVTGLAGLADKSVDHVICDPPYSERVHSKSMRSAPGSPGKHKGISAPRSFSFPHIAADQMEAVSCQLARVVRRWSLMFCDVESVERWFLATERAGLETVRTGAWIKRGGTPQFTGDRPGVAFEAIAIVHPAGRKRWNGGGRVGLWDFTIAKEGVDGRYHEAQKPVGLMEALVKDFTDPGELICDPFAGSGTTGIAAIRLGRRFIGWERDPKYHAAAMKRLNAAREQMSLFERRVG